MGNAVSAENAGSAGKRSGVTNGFLAAAFAITGWCSVSGEPSQGYCDSGYCEPIAALEPSVYGKT